MTYAPATLNALATYWKGQGGVNLGIVGNTGHTKGYHLGKDRIFDGSGPGIGWNDYSVKTARDKAGLTNGAAAIDLGRLDGALKPLWRFSEWLAKECMARKPDTRDVREVIFWSESRQRVVGWSALAPDRLINDYGDLSHKTHTHISYFRDSETRDKRPLFRRYPGFAVTPPPTEADVPTMNEYLPGYTVVLKGTSNVRTEPKLSATLIRHVPADKTETWVVTGNVKGDKDVDGGCTTTTWWTRWSGGRWEYTSGCNVPGAPVPPASDCSDEVDDAYKRGYAKGESDTKAKAKAVHTVTVVYE